MTKLSLIVAFTGNRIALTPQSAVGMGLPSDLKASRVSHNAPTHGTWISDGEYVLATHAIYSVLP